MVQDTASATLLSAQHVWNSLEVTKMLVSALTPLAVLALGFWINRRLKTFEHLQWAAQKVVEKRLAIFDEIAPKLNDILCYFTFVGGWKDLSPPEVIRCKRELDRLVHVFAALFPESYLSRYNDFMNLCFETYTGWGHDARLRTPFERRKQALGATWKKEWDPCFSEMDAVSEPEEIRRAYTALMKLLARELGVGLSAEHVPAGRIPANIR